jgi:hypothetical protein
MKESFHYLQIFALQEDRGLQISHLMLYFFKNIIMQEQKKNEKATKKLKPLLLNPFFLMKINIKFK